MPYPTVDVVIPVYKPPMERLRRILDATLSQEGFTSITLVHDGPDSDVELALREEAARDSRIRVVMGARTGSDVGTRSAISDHIDSEVLIFIDDDVVPTAGLVAGHVAALEQNPGIVMGRLRTVIDGPKTPLRPAALLYDRWYQAGRERWLADPRNAYANFWAGNFSMRAETFERIDKFLPSPDVHYGHDGFYGLVARELGITVTYADDIIGEHMVEKRLERVPAIGYSFGGSAAVMARGVEPVLPDKAQELRSLVAKVRSVPGLKWVTAHYAKHPQRVRSGLIKTAARANSLGLDAVTLRLLDAGYLLEVTRGYSEKDAPNAASREMTQLLTAARDAG